MKVQTLLTVVAIAAGGLQMPAHGLSNTARDPRIAVQEEYDIAVKRGTVEAIELFIARHPESVLVDAAQKLRRELIAKTPKQ